MQGNSSTGSRSTVRPATGRLGVLTPGLGAVATTFIAGVESIRRGLSKPIGSLTQMATIRLGKRTDKRSPLIREFVPLANLEDIVFGAWDPIPDDAYTAAKGGIKNLTRSMAVEWAQHGIQANAIGPGYMLTDMNEALVNNTDFNNWLMGRIPSKRWGKPDELVGAAIFLASDASTYVNGQIIYVDGGMIAAM